MEISLLTNNSIRIKGKIGSLIVNPLIKATDANGYIFDNETTVDNSKLNPDAVRLKGPGEYEFGGFKVTGTKINGETVYTIRVDKIEILLGTRQYLEKEYSKLNEHHIVVLNNTNVGDSSFVSSLATNVIIYYGEKAEENMNHFSKDGYKKETKYSVTFDKLPQEIEKVLLA